MKISTRSSRGTIMILVVVCLALIATMGVVYLLTARSDRGNVRAVNQTMDLDLAQDSVLQMLRQHLYESSVDSAGNLLGTNASSGAQRRARYFDMPEVGATAGSSVGDANMPDQPWLTLATDQPNGAAYDRYTRFYTRGPGGTWTFNRLNPSDNSFTSLSPTAAEVAVMDGSNGAPLDSVWYLLNFNSAQSLRYRFAVRIIETSGLANLNAGSIEQTPADPDGRFLSSFHLQRLMNVSDSASQLQLSNDVVRGRGGLATGGVAFSLANWHEHLLSYEWMQNPGPPLGAFSNAEPFDWSDELEIRARDPRRSAYSARPEVIWPNTLSDIATTRQLFTTYSFDRNVRPRNTPTLTWSTGTLYRAGVWTTDSGNAYECLVDHLSATGNRPPNVAFWRPMGAASGTNAGYTVNGQTIYPRYPMRVNVNSRLPAAAAWQSDRTYIVGDTVIGADGNTYVCAMMHRSNNDTTKMYGGNQPGAPLTNPNGSCFWDPPPAWVTGTAYTPGQRVLFNGEVYVCRVNSTSWDAGDVTKTPAVLAADSGKRWWYKGPSVLTNYDRAQVLAATAANIAATMRLPLTSTALANPNAYTEEEARAFAVNYLTYRASSGRIENNLYSLPQGPSFLDAEGLCVRTGTWNGGTFTSASRDFTSANVNEFKSEVAGKTYVGYAAQPFINEIVVQCDSNGAIVDAGIELLNPHVVALNFQQPSQPTAGWKLYIYKTGNTTPTVIDLGALFVNNANQPVGIPTQGVVCISESSATDSLNTIAIANGCPTSHAKLSAGLINALGTSGDIILTRPYIPRGQTTFTADAVVDRFTYSLGTAAASAVLSTQRANANASGVDLFLAARANASNVVGDTDTNTATPRGDTFGTSNGAQTVTPALPSPTPTINLEDRFAVAGNFTPDTHFTLANYADFNRIIRIANSFTLTGSETLTTNLPTTRTISNQFRAIFDPSTPPMPNSEFAYEAAIRFDFKAKPGLYSNPSDVPAGDPARRLGDPRAIALLDYLTMIDRANDLIDTGGGIHDINKVRLPGRININTASPDIIKSISATNMSDQHVANIVSFRDRRTVPYQYNGMPAVDFANPPSGVAPSPGIGIRSMAELYFVLSPAPPTNNAPATLVERDLPWARLASICTTRSDAFVVYGVLEAIRPSATHNNASDWYAASSDDPSSNAVNRLQARRRFIALIDRSWSNAPRGQSNFALPRVIAVRDLPP